MKTAVLLSGCGVYDGSEIHETVLTFLELEKQKIEFFCVAPNIDHYHVINHLNGKQLDEKRNVLIESSRISRGNVVSLDDIDYSEISSLVIPGGFGAAKNLSDWAFNGPDCNIHSDVKELILHCLNKSKPIVALCISPNLIAKSIVNSDYKPNLTLGSEFHDSEYNISEIHKNISSLGVITHSKKITEICVDEDLKIISAPCYMMKASISEVHFNISQAIIKLKNFL